MRPWTIVVRLAALLVLISSVSDYCAFDVNDPEALMNQTARVVIVQTVLAVNAPLLRTSDLPDDHCLCCSPGFASQPVTLQSPCLISSSVEHHAVQPPTISIRVRKLPPKSQAIVL
jgi:hypothetical protein